MLEKETQIETKGREQNLYQIMMQMCLCIHILLMGFFACMQIWFMVTVNILSVLLYCFGVARIKTTKKISQWLLAIYSEILIHCVLCNLIIGWGYGFSLYMLLMTPITYNVCCFSKNGREGYRHANILSIASLIIVLISCVAGGSANRCDHDVDVWIQSDRVGCMLDLFFTVFRPVHQGLLYAAGKKDERTTFLSQS